MLPPPIPPQCFELSTEQQFQLAAARTQLASADPDQMRSLILDLMTQKLANDNLIKFLVKSFGGCE